MVLLWGLLFMLVLAMISGEREMLRRGRGNEWSDVSIECEGKRNDDDLMDHFFIGVI